LARVALGENMQLNLTAANFQSTKKGRRAFLVATASSCVWPRFVSAQDFRSKPIRLVVGFAPGGSIDYIARVIAPHIAESLQTSVIVENRGGASGTIGSRYVAASNPDGQTLMLAPPSAIVIAPQVMPSAPFNPLTDFTPINIVGAIPEVLAVRSGLGVRNLSDLIALARTRSVSIASSGIGTMTHLTIELLAKTANCRFLHVPYKGGSPGIADTLAGHIDGVVSDLTPMVPLLKDGYQLAPVVVTSEKRSRLLPEVPTVNESFPSFGGATDWAGVFAPARTPPEVIAGINDAIVKVMLREDVAAPMSKNGVVPSTMASSDAFRAFVGAEFDRWGKLVKEKHIVTS
jgi:tripartite-type tricarboxylate transporter receptor subunit TctC